MDESQIENDYFYNVLAGILTETGDYIGARAEKAILKEFWKLQAERDALKEIILNCPECARTIKGLYHEATRKEIKDVE
jgi:hypothetical protein